MPTPDTQRSIPVNHLTVCTQHPYKNWTLWQSPLPGRYLGLLLTFWPLDSAHCFSRWSCWVSCFSNLAHSDFSSLIVRSLSLMDALNFSSFAVISWQLGQFPPYCTKYISCYNIFHFIIHGGKVEEPSPETKNYLKCMLFTQSINEERYIYFSKQRHTIKFTWKYRYQTMSNLIFRCIEFKKIDCV